MNEKCVDTPSRPSSQLESTIVSLSNEINTLGCIVEQICLTVGFNRKEANSPDFDTSTIRGELARMGHRLETCNAELAQIVGALAEELGGLKIL